MPNIICRRLVILFAGAALLAGVSSAQRRGPAAFTDAALTGLYAVESQGDGHVSAGVGTVRYDGDGKTTRRIVVSAPNDEGGRSRLVFESEGTYAINPDGTGTATYVNIVSNGEIRSVTFDFVVRKSESRWIPGRGQATIATELFFVQREAGVTVSLVTNEQSRIADQ